MSQHNRLLRASAGTGKTYQLSNRYLQLLFAGEFPERILATTFTRKAAGEILSRILLRLAQAADNPKERKDLAKALGKSELSAEECRRQLVQTLRRLHVLRVSTLDAFFMELAGSYALELGLPPGWTIGESWQDASLRAEAINDVLNGEELSTLLTLFHLLTKGDAERSVAQLIGDLVDTIYSIFIEAPSEAWQKIPAGAMLKNEEVEALAAQLSALPAANHKIIDASVRKDVDLISQRNWLELIKKGYSNAVLTKEEKYCSRAIPDHVRELYESLLKRATNEILFQLASQTKATHELLSHFDVAYEQQKQSQRILRFDDVTRRLSVRRDANREGSLFRMNGRIDHLLLDEFQDTSFAQWQVLFPLAQRAHKRGSVFCVGDQKQAIYGWRGGMAGLFNAVEKLLPDIKNETLAKSYRSSPIIMEVVNRVFTQMVNHPNLEHREDAVRRWRDNFPPHETARDDYPGYAAIHVSPDVDTDEEDPTEQHFIYAAELIASLVKEAPGRSVGVLCRKNAVVARMIYELRKLQIPASEEGGNPLTDSAPVEAVLSLLHLIDHPGDTICSFHVSHTPLGAIIGLPPDSTQSAVDILTERLRREIAERGLGPLCLDWARQLADVCNERDRNRLQQLVEMAYDYSVESSLRMTDFVDLVRDRRVPDPAAVDVRVMTIHQSKGLEFDIVVLPELEDKLSGQTPTFLAHRPSASDPIEIVSRYITKDAMPLLPKSLQKLFETHQNEEMEGILCLLYVALTRAAHALHLVLRCSKESEKQLPKTVSGLLRAALVGTERLTALTTPFELGDRCWYRASADQPKTDVEDRPPSPPTPAKITLQPPRPQRSRGWQRVTPSQLEGGRRVQWQTLFGESHGGDFSRGTLFHAWFELVEWLDDSIPTIEQLMERGKEMSTDIGTLIDQLPRLAEQFAKTLAQPRLKSLLQRSFYSSQLASHGAGAKLKVEREFPFALRQRDELVQGAIDRLVLVEDKSGIVAAEIIDYKTDAIPLDDPAALVTKVAFYRPQLLAYRQAVAEMFRLPAERVTARLMFVSCDQIANVEP